VAGRAIDWLAAWSHLQKAPEFGGVPNPVAALGKPLIGGLPLLQRHKIRILCLLYRVHIWQAPS